MVYVDEIRLCIPKKIWKGNKFCHLFADTLEELFLFAEKIGLKKSWFQHKRNFPHFDLTEKRRILAIQAGAKELNREEFYSFYKRSIKGI